MQPNNPSKEDNERTVAHLIRTISDNLVHSTRHNDEALTASNMENTNFNIEHAIKHNGEIEKHLQKLIDTLKVNDPAFKKEWELMEAITAKSAHARVLVGNSAWKARYHA